MSATQNQRGCSPRRNEITLWTSGIVLVHIAGTAILIVTNPAKDGPGRDRGALTGCQPSDEGGLRYT